jgi:hypothetical protein
MKVGGAGAAATTGGATRAARGSGEGFAVSDVQVTRETASAHAASGVGAIGSLDALLALQETPGPLERRKRAIRRAGRLLDMLDAVKLSLIGGESPGHALRQLSLALNEARDGTEDGGLDAVLDHIDTRAAVELAKDEVARRVSGAAHDNSPRVAGSH